MRKPKPRRDGALDHADALDAAGALGGRRLLIDRPRKKGAIADELDAAGALRRRRLICDCARQEGCAAAERDAAGALGGRRLVRNCPREEGADGMEAIASRPRSDRHQLHQLRSDVSIC